MHIWPHGYSYPTSSTSSSTMEDPGSGSGSGSSSDSEECMLGVYSILKSSFDTDHWKTI